MDSRTRKIKMLRRKNVCEYSGEIIGNKPAILVKYAREYLIKMGYLVSNYKFLFVIFSLFFINISSISSLEFDNVKGDLIINESTSEYGRIEIKDWFGLQDLVTLELEENTNVCGVDCSAKTRIVMHQRGVLIDNVKFVGAPVKEYQFYIKTGERETGNMIDDYEYQCDAITTFNLTKGTKCDWVKIGEHAETEPLWIKYHLGDEVGIGEYIVKLEGKKDFYETTDWIITSQGQEIEEWADWGSGGTITTDGGYTIHTFYANGTFEPQSAGVVTALVVAGGGSGGGHVANPCAGGGGGGAGGVIFNETYNLQATSYDVVIGVGGAMVSESASSNNGTDSWFGNIRATGGGGGGTTSPVEGSRGGSGGGGDGNNGAGGVGTANQGNSGGAGSDGAGAGAGGGSATQGEDTPGGADSYRGGNGGNGTQYNINGTSYYYGGGGGGGTAGATRYGGIGGLGGGGEGGDSTVDLNGHDAGGYGSGGGGVGCDYSTGANSGAGSGGIVMIRYPTNYTAGSVVTTLLDSPIDYYNSTLSSVTFECNSTTDSAGGEVLTNITLYIDSVLNETKSISGLSDSETFIKNLPNAVYDWNCLAYDNSSSFDWGTNRTLTIDAPSIVTTTLDSPADAYSLPDEVNSVEFICSATTDSKGGEVLTNLSLYLGGVLNETKTISGLSNSSTFTKSLPNVTTNWSCLAYDNGNIYNMTSTRSLVYTPPIEYKSSAQWLQVDFDSPMTVAMFYILFAIAGLLVLTKKEVLAGGMLIILGFVLLFSNFNVILSFIVISGGVVLLFARV